MNEIEIIENTPNGSVVEYGPEDDAETVEQAVGTGWSVDWQTPAYKLASGRWRSPVFPAAVRYEVVLVEATIEGNWGSACVGRTYATRALAQAAIDADPTAKPDAHGNTCTLEIVAVAVEGQRYRIQIDEETGGDETWDALHDYADAHPAPDALRPFVILGGAHLGDEVMVDQAAGEAAIAWLAAAAEALDWDERTTPVLVTPESD